MPVPSSLSALAPTVVVIEDEAQIARFVSLALEGEGMVSHVAGTVRDGLIAAGTRQPDLLILDLGLPDGDGIVLVRELRAFSDVPVLVLSARTQESDKVAALDAGADDYLTKPFGVAELMARVRVLLRRHARQDASSRDGKVTVGDVEIDLVAREVSRGGEALHLTPIEYRLLSVLIRHAGKVLTHRQLLLEVWGPAYVEHSHYLRIYMGHLRQKLEADPAQPQHLLTETGVGYRLVP
ncbi:two-component system response regulator KdpE [Jeongeupia naejangsanensis]|uniref:Two-component system response regulator KdpE n=1 Tax=Jeongeupia naejangsanensis TaxID=613195 RepID=A0ABS2BI06_9NEIS|nr:two-component system response regulator KdpE [Jeongeupia naejangsanensis]MBM3115075.1 two-component system response regulator KdpE [Jeongeupia naejangsanensis]